MSASAHHWRASFASDSPERPRGTLRISGRAILPDFSNGSGLRTAAYPFGVSALPSGAVWGRSCRDDGPKYYFESSRFDCLVGVFGCSLRHFEKRLASERNVFLVRPSIGQALANDALRRDFRAVIIAVNWRGRPP
jgi:hypothetical protein